MRYWHPFTESAVADIKADDVDEVVVLPLYPHFSISTSGSSFRELQRLRQADPFFAAMPIRCIRSYHDDQGYIDAMAGLIAREIQACPDPDSAHVFFSAHGVPKSYVEEAGDPYQGEIETCARRSSRSWRPHWATATLSPLPIRAGWVLWSGSSPTPTRHWRS